MQARWHDGVVTSLPTDHAAAIIHIGIDPVINLHIISVHWYGVMYATAFLVAFRFGALPHLTKRGVDAGLVERMTGWTILFGLIGARLYYVVQSDLSYFLHNPVHILAVWEGGMAFFGAIIASTATILVLCRRHHLSFWLLIDAGALFATVGQPIGRIGNLINGDILGPPSTLPWATAYTNPHAILQPGFSQCTAVQCVAYQPAGVYEAIGTLLILALLLILRHRGVRAGVLGIAYVGLYGISQVLIFHWRAHMPTYAGLAQAQWSGLVALIVGVPFLILLWRRTRSDDPATVHPGAAASDRPAAA